MHLKPSRNLMVETRDRQRYLVPVEVLRPARGLSHLLADAEAEPEEENAEPCVLPSLDSRVFELVVQWCSMRRDQPEPEPSPVQAQAGRRPVRPQLTPLSKPELLFLDRPAAELEQLAQAGRYLGIRSLQLYAEQLLRCR